MHTLLFGCNFVILINRAAGTSPEHVFLFFLACKLYWPNTTQSSKELKRRREKTPLFRCSFEHIFFGRIKSKLQLAIMSWTIVNYFRSKCKQERETWICAKRSETKKSTAQTNGMERIEYSGSFAIPFSSMPHLITATVFFHQNVNEICLRLVCFLWECVFFCNCCVIKWYHFNEHMLPKHWQTNINSTMILYIFEIWCDAFKIESMLLDLLLLPTNLFSVTWSRHTQQATTWSWFFVYQVLLVNRCISLVLCFVVALTFRRMHCCTAYIQMWYSSEDLAQVLQCEVSCCTCTMQSNIQ